MSTTATDQDQHVKVPDLNGIVFVSDRKEEKQFIEFPYEHYQGDAYWVPPLKMEQKKLINRDKNPFFDHGDMALFLAKKNDKLAGRIAAIEDYRFNEHHGTSIGFFGFFECIDDAGVANLLFRVASDWLKERGWEKMMGPTNPSMMDELGVLVDGFDHYPSIMMPYSKTYYDELIKGQGFEKAMDLYAYRVDQDSLHKERFERAQKMLKRRISGLNIRQIDLKNIDPEIKIVGEIYNKAWAHNWGFLPHREKDFKQLADDPKMVLDPEVAAIAEIDGEPIGFTVSLPDYNQVFRKMDGRMLPTGIFKFLYYRKKINACRTALMGVVPEHQGKGIDALLNNFTILNGWDNYYSSEMSWILESNVNMIRIAERSGAYHEKTYRLYEKEL